MKLEAAFNQGGTPTIMMINQATVDLGVGFATMFSAMKKFLDTAFVPVWGTPANLLMGVDFVPGCWAMVLMDDADQAGALGYHDLTKDGQPISKIFVKTTIAAGEKVSVTACHELCEMLVDPGCQMWADNGKGVMHAYETSDAVEEEEFLVDGIAMSDFVYPAFFESFRIGQSVKFDHLGKVTKPFQTLKGGYQIVMREGKVGQVFGSIEKAERFAKEDRRMHRSEYRCPRA